MRDVTVLTAEDILGIAEDTPGRLFTGDPDAARREYHALAIRWHPDRCGEIEAGRVFRHVAALYRAAGRRLRDRAWRTPGVVEFEDEEGRRFRLRFLRQKGFELGEMYIGRRTIAFAVAHQHRDLFDNALGAIGSFTFGSDRMRDEIARCQPETVRHLRTADRLVLVVRNPPDMVLLEDLVAHLGGTIDPRHAAWIVSSLENLACYLGYAGIVHNAIGPATCFVSSAAHVCALLGGWWYAARVGRPLVAVPARTIDQGPADLARTGIGDPRTDLYLIRPPAARSWTIRAVPAC
ncbi:J domain-containing protein [Inquilinus limosus]|uniref:J domain-containing protein n=1 Tax=Inquilinus limosus TaxID=171674 RepID=UPI000690DAB6|nr:J domain-containing protein [Inquilinus limosus]